MARKSAKAKKTKKTLSARVRAREKTPARTRGEGVKSQAQRAKFLELIGKGKSITGAARDASVSRYALYQWRKEIPQFGAAWDEALEAGLDALEDKARELAEEGSEKLLMFLLKAGRPEKYRENIEVRGNLHLTHEEALELLE
jgi:hypothetical protein